MGIAESYELRYRYTHEGIEGFDKAAEKIRAIKKDLGGTGDGFDDLRARIAKAKESIESTNHQLAEMAANSAPRATSSIGGVATAAATTAAAMAAMAVSIVKSQADAQRVLAATSQALGLTAQQGQRVEFAFNAAGMSMAVFEAAARSLTHRTNEQERALKGLRIETSEITGRQRAAGALFLETADKISRITNEFERQRTAAAALGPEVAAALDPILKSGELLGPAIDNGLTKHLEIARLQMTRLDAEWERFKTNFGGALAPIVIPMLAVAGGLASGKSQENAIRSFTLGGLLRDGLEAAGGIGALGSIPVRPLSTPGSSVDKAAAIDKARAAAFSEHFLNSTPEGLRIRRGQLDSRISELASEITGRGIGFGAQQAKNAELVQLRSELAAVDAQLKALTSTANTSRDAISHLLATLNARSLDPLGQIILRTQEALRGVKLSGADRGRVNEALTGALQREIASRPQLATESIDLRGTSFLFAGQRPVANSATVDPAITEQTIATFRERSVNALERSVAFTERIARLTAGPGGELAAVEKIADLREKAAMRMYQITQDRARLEADLDQAQKDRIVALLEIQERSAAQYRQFFSQAVMAGFTRGDGGGLAGFGRAQGRALVGQLSTNAGSLIYDHAGAVFSKVFGEDGTSGSKAIDALLGGTLFDPKNALKVSTDANTTATIANTLMLKQLTTGAAAGGGAGVAQIAGMAGVPGAEHIASLIKWGTRKSGADLPDPMALASQDATATLARTTVDPFNGNGIPQIGNLNARTGSFGFAQGVTTAGIAAATAVGVASGIKQGGARGGLLAGGSALGGVAALLPLLGATGPAAPIAAAGALGVALIASMLKDPKQQFAEAQDRLLEERIYRGPRGLAYTRDFNDGEFAGYGRDGAPRVLHVHINALDAKSILDRKQEIADAVSGAIAGGHPLRGTMAELPFTG